MNVKQAVPDIPKPIPEREVCNFLQSKLSIQIATIDYDYFIFIDPDDGNKIKARSGKKGGIFSSHETNADTVINECLTDLTNGGWIFLGPGTFNMYTQITSSHNVNIIGSGRGTTLLVRQDTAKYSSVVLSGTNIVVAQLTLDGNYPINNTTNAFSELNLSGTNILVFDVEVKNFKSFGISNSGAAIISNCIVGPSTNTTSPTTGAIFSGANTMTTIYGCTIADNAGGAFFGGGITTIQDSYFGNNVATYNGGQIAGSRNNIVLTVLGCVIDAGQGTAGDSGIEVTMTGGGGGAEHIIVGNRITGATNWGIVTDPSPDVLPTVIRNNVIKNCGLGAIRMWAPNQKYFVIERNICCDDRPAPIQRYGIEIVGTGADYYIIKNNICYGNVRGQIRDLGMGTNKIVRDNTLEKPA